VTLTGPDKTPERCMPVQKNGGFVRACKRQGMRWQLRQDYADNLRRGKSERRIEMDNRGTRLSQCQVQEVWPNEQVASDGVVGDRGRVPPRGSVVKAISTGPGMNTLLAFVTVKDQVLA
jgi:hypothetical protein